MKRNSSSLDKHLDKLAQITKTKTKFNKDNSEILEKLKDSNVCLIIDNLVTDTNERYVNIDFKSKLNELKSELDVFDLKNNVFKSISEDIVIYNYVIFFGNNLASIKKLTGSFLRQNINKSIIVIDDFFLPFYTKDFVEYRNTLSSNGSHFMSFDLLISILKN